jgi:hypothetical protein
MGSETHGSEGTPCLQMQVGLRYIVVTPSDDGTFATGDHIVRLADGDISCREGRGWIDGKDVPDAAEGMTVVPDVEWAREKINDLKAQIMVLKEQYPGASPEETANDKPEPESMEILPGP